MSTTLPPVYVVPNPAIPKAVGFLNVLFGSVLLLFGVAQVGWAVIAPSMARAAQTARDLRVEAEKKERAAEVARLRSLVASARTEEERREREARLHDAEARPLKNANLNGQIVLGLDDLLDHGYTWAGAVSGVLLNVAMIVAGAGLVGLRAWGRRLALWVAGLKLARLVAVAAVTLLVLIPHNTRDTQRRLLEEGAEAENAPPSAESRREAAQIAQVVAAASSVYAVGFLVFGAIYPAVVLFLLTRRSARAAIHAANRPHRPKPNRPEEAVALE